jgi:hypothetical protein
VRGEGEKRGKRNPVSFPEWNCLPRTIKPASHLKERLLNHSLAPCLDWLKEKKKRVVTSETVRKGLLARNSTKTKVTPGTEKRWGEKTLSIDQISGLYSPSFLHFAQDHWSSHDESTTCTFLVSWHWSTGINTHKHANTQASGQVRPRGEIFRKSGPPPHPSATRKTLDIPTWIEYEKQNMKGKKNC